MILVGPFQMNHSILFILLLSYSYVALRNGNIFFYFGHSDSALLVQDKSWGFFPAEIASIRAFIIF